MFNSLNKISVTIKSEIKNIKDLTELNNFKSKYLGKKSIITLYFSKLALVNIPERIQCSSILNTFKRKIKHKIIQKKSSLRNRFLSDQAQSSYLDYSLPGRRIERGSLHPITMIINEIKEIFYQWGFVIYSGPELENIYYNFDSLNIPINHPSRSMGDTFWFDSNHVLRTQTSSAQMRILKKYSYPIKAIVPGKVFRRDFDHTHTPMFHQIEGLIVDKSISFSNLKWILKNLVIKIFKKNIKIRFRSSYFPFTCPSAEVDIQNKFGDWIEILGCGMVHPNVLKNFNIDRNIYSACAFGMGVERIAMLKYSLSDIRYFFENDIRFLKQFV
ncbi:phenylalanine--tRNA ligase subunit alpha [Buchnera aphidicola]|uniref:phenylalanine--tRNA ligase subunit alpha n=1 Tax=Buchnera aphidicola TaxID=9 RepID=UPI00094D10B7